MRYYEEAKTERVNRRTALFLTAAIYFIIFSGIVFANRPELLPEVVKEWLEIQNSNQQKDIKKELPAKKERA